MEFYQLENLIAVIEEHSFTRAAERVFRTQAAVSVAIKKLEDELGAQLVIRDSSDCSLTEAGELALQYARRMIDLRNEMQRRLVEYTGLGTGSVSIAAHESAARYLLPDPMAAFHKAFPEIRIEARVCGIDEVASLVAERVVDLGFSVRPTHLRGLRSELILTDPLVLVTAPNHQLTQHHRVRIVDLEHEKFFAHHLHTRTIEAIQQLFEANRVSFTIVAELWNFETIKQFVKSGSGIAVIPLSVARPDLENGSLVVVSLEEMSISREIEVLYRDKDKLLPAPAELLKVLRGWSWNFGQQFLLQPGPSAVDLDDGAESNAVVQGPRLAGARRRDPRGQRAN